MGKEKTLMELDIKTIEKDNRFKPFCSSCTTDDYYITETERTIESGKDNGGKKVSYIGLNAYCSSCNRLLFVPSVHEESNRRIREAIAKSNDESGEFV